MLNLKNIFLIGLIYSFIPSLIFAEEVKLPDFSKTIFGAQEARSIVVADINVYNIKKISQSRWETGETEIKISFDIINKKGVQSQMVYGVELIKENKDKTQIFVDQKVYNDSVSLGENSTVHKEIVYVAPKYLKGEYQLWIKVKNSNGLTLAIGLYQGSLILDGDKIDYVEIVQGSCFLKVKDEKNNKRYTLDQGVDILPTEDIVVFCDVVDRLKDQVVILPVFETFWRSTFGEKIVTKETPYSGIILKPNLKKTISFIIPKAEKPQAYDVRFALRNNKGDIVSNYLIFHYVLRGLSATIQNLVLNKDFYRDGDIANLDLTWTSSADNFLGSRYGSEAKINNIFADIKIMSGNKDCVEPIVSEKLEYSQEGISSSIKDLRIMRNCDDPNILVYLKDSNGNIFDQKIFNIKTVTKLKFKVDFQTMIFVLMASILIILISWFIRSKMENYK